MLIYHHVFSAVKDKHVLLPPGTSNLVTETAWPLLQASKQIYLEAIPAYYRQTVFAIDHQPRLSALEAKVSENFKRHVRHMHIFSTKWQLDLTPLQCLPALKTVRLEIVDTWLYERPSATRKSTLEHATLKEALCALVSQSSASGLVSQSDEVTEAAPTSATGAKVMATIADMTANVSIEFVYEYKSYFFEDESDDLLDFCFCWKKKVCTCAICADKR